MVWYEISNIYSYMKEAQQESCTNIELLICLFQTNTLFEQELTSMNITKPFSPFAPETYDAVWSIALALKGAEELWQNESKLSQKRNRKKLDLFDYTRKDLVKDFLEQFSHLKFQGISVNNKKKLF